MGLSYSETQLAVKTGVILFFLVLLFIFFSTRELKKKERLVRIAEVGPAVCGD